MMQIIEHITQNIKYAINVKVITRFQIKELGKEGVVVFTLLRKVFAFIVILKKKMNIYTGVIISNFFI